MLRGFAVGFAIGAWVGWRLWPRTVAQPARPFDYRYPETWVPFPSIWDPAIGWGNITIAPGPNTTYTEKH